MPGIQTFIVRASVFVIIITDIFAGDLSSVLFETHHSNGRCECYRAHDEAVILQELHSLTNDGVMMNAGADISLPSHSSPQSRYCGCWLGRTVSPACSMTGAA